MQRQNKQKLGFLGNGITYAKTGLRTHEFNLRAQARSYVHKYLPRKPNLHKNRAKAKQNIKHKI